MRKNSSLNIATALVLTACFSMSAGIFLGIKNMNSFLVSWGQSLEMTVYLKDGVEPSEKENLLTQIKETQNVRQIKSVSPEENFATFKEQMGDTLPSVAAVHDIKGLVPATLQIIFDFKNSLQDPLQVFSGLADKLKNSPAVDQVSYGQIWVEKFSTFFTLIRSSFWAVAIVVALATVFILSNVVRAWVHAKRFEIEVMELVGATAFTIRKPFILRGLFYGAFTGLAGVGLVTLGFHFATKLLGQHKILSAMVTHLQGFTGVEILFFVIMSGGLGLIASYLCVREINSGWAAAEAR